MKKTHPLMKGTKVLSQVRVLRPLALGGVLCALTASADSNWTGAAGDNDLANAANWSAGLPTSGNANFNGVLDGLTLSKDLTIGSGINVNFNGAGAVNLDFGADRKLSVGYRTFVKSQAVVTLKSGTYQHTGDRFFVGDNCSDATMVIDGSDSSLIGAPATSGNSYISVGSANTADSRNNLLKVQNGGYLEGFLILGRLAGTPGRITCGTNTVLITGEGSSYKATTTTYLGQQQGLSHLVVTDKATATMALVDMGTKGTNDKNTFSGPQNEMRVSDGGVATVSGELHVGNYSCSNRVEVTSGGQMTVSGLFSTSVNSDTTLTSPMLPFDNIVRVTGEGSLLTLNGGLWLGRTQLSHGDRFEVRDGAKAVFGNKNALYLIGGNIGSRNNCVLVDGGTLEIDNATTFLGRETEGNSLVVTNGGVVTANNFFYVGTDSSELVSNGGSSNTLEVAAGGTFNMNSQLRLGWFNRKDGTKPGSNKLWIHGKDALFTTPYQVIYDRFDGQIGNQLIIEDGGAFESSSMVCFGYTQRAGGFSSNILVRVTGEGSRFVIKTADDFVLAHNNAANTTNVCARVSVAEGGEISLNGGSVQIGRGGDGSDGIVCEGNTLHIGPGGRFSHVINWQNNNQRSFVLGSSRAAQHNLVRVEGEFSLVNTGLRGSAFFVGNNGPSNRFEIVNGGRATIDNGSPYVGGNDSARDNALYVGAGSTLALTNLEFLIVGNGGARADLTVDGGRIDSLGCSRIVIGALPAASNCSFHVVNGAVADLHRLVLGDQGPNATAVISNATLNLFYDANMLHLSPGYLEMGYTEKANPANATLVIAGRCPKVNIGQNIRMRNATAQIRFEIPAEGFEETPIVCQGGFQTVATGASLHVSAAADWPRGSKVTLLTTKNGGQISNLTLTCDEGLRVRRVGNAIVASKPGGGLFIVR